MSIVTHTSPFSGLITTRETFDAFAPDASHELRGMTGVGTCKSPAPWPSEYVVYPVEAPDDSIARIRSAKGFVPWGEGYRWIGLAGVPVALAGDRLRVSFGCDHAWEVVNRYKETPMAHHEGEFLYGQIGGLEVTFQFETEDGMCGVVDDEGSPLLLPPEELTPIK